METRPYKANKKILLGQDNNALVFLFAVNALMFVIVNFIKIVYYLSEIPDEFFYRQVLNWLSLPPQTDTLLTRPWTFISTMITHHSIWQLISSMLWLWCFGYILQDLAGNNKLIPIYIYGGITGSVFFVLMNNMVPVLANQVGTAAPLLGAGSAVMAIAVATTTLAPDYRIFPLINGGIPLWVITLIFVAIDFATLAGSNAGIGAGHLAAGVVGYLFIRQLRRGNDWGAWMNRFADWLDDLFNPEKKHQQKTSSERHFYKAEAKPFDRKPNLTQQRLDEILDKINQQGYQFLTDEEKEFLKKASKEDL
ncbi:MAG: rhomboid family intramembrane serine protease [Sediminibacterium sp.]|jgi:membrane associated rhomboid family serine protease|uniref:rhomboid family intramembrane serine protease n=1 Tax=Sediminibacterium sp. TaxID=1917865 RepID=UPI002ABC6FB0|nr:rhomboid family intramembrane serine protease [Sediminibacterium sp.]MDZ4071572.1 rhomboid family intramembrane serine protease [Sediminibacterium sp.]